jgi:hypothetical protein
MRLANKSGDRLKIMHGSTQAGIIIAKQLAVLLL